MGVIVLAGRKRTIAVRDTFPALRLVGLAGCCLLLISACAGRPPASVAAESAVCPDISGRYCANGARWQRGSTELTRAYLPYYLGVSAADRALIDSVEIEGATEGALRMRLLGGGRVLASAEIRAPELVCGAARVALQMDAIPWGGAGPLLALGASAGWRLLRRDADGSLRIEEQRHETGTVFLVLPLYIDSSSWLRFPSKVNAACD